MSEPTNEVDDATRQFGVPGEWTWREEDERKLLELYRAAGEDLQEVILDVVRILVSRLAAALGFREA